MAEAKSGQWLRALRSGQIKPDELAVDNCDVPHCPFCAALRLYEAEQRIASTYEATGLLSLPRRSVGERDGYLTDKDALYERVRRNLKP